MGKYDSFFSEKAPEALNKKILANAQAELENLRKKNRKAKWVSLFFPLGTAAAVAVLALYLNFGISNSKMTEGDAVGLMTIAALGNEFVNQVLEEEEVLEFMDELSVLEEYETLEAMSDMDLEGLDG